MKWDIPLNKDFYGLIGYPIEHSLSPIIHNYAFKLENIRAKYILIQIEDGFLKRALSKLRREEGLRGLNVTMPHKTDIIPFLDKLDPSSKLSNSVNTIKFSNISVGYDTDGIGFLESLKYNSIDVKDKKVVLLGAGGAARSIAAQLAIHGAHITIANRTTKNAQIVAAMYKEMFKTDIATIKLEKNALKKPVAESDIIINTTALGMKQRETIITSDMLNSSTFVIDIIYNPLKTALMIEAENANCKTMNGVSMLVHQAAKSFQIWTDKKPNIEKLMQKVESHLKATTSQQ